MAKKKDREAVLLERDRLYAEHMYRAERGSHGGAERVGEPLGPWADHKPGLFERFVMYVLGVK